MKELTFCNNKNASVYERADPLQQNSGRIVAFVARLLRPL